MDGGLGLESIPEEITSSATLARVADGLRAAGYPQSDIENILAGNFLRFFRENLPQPR
jgi:membrane dipeptidase